MRLQASRENCIQARAALAQLSQPTPHPLYVLHLPLAFVSLDFHSLVLSESTRDYRRYTSRLLRRSKLRYKDVLRRPFGAV